MPTEREWGQPNKWHRIKSFTKDNLDIAGISNLSDSYKDKGIKKIDVLVKFQHTDLKQHLTDQKIFYYINEVHKIKSYPSLTSIMRILNASKSKRISKEMKNLPFWGKLSNYNYPGLRSVHIKPFIYPLLQSWKPFEDNENVKMHSDLTPNLWPLKKPNEYISDPRILKIREKHRRAYEPWTDREDGLLRQQYDNNKIIRSLSEFFQRNPGAIRGRLTKLDLIPKEAEQLYFKSISPGYREKAKIQSTNEKLDANLKQIVCLATSRKYGGYCVAGKEFTKEKSWKWVRPVSNRKDGELSAKHLTYGDKKYPKLLDMITFCIKKPFPHYYQTENYLIMENQCWVKSGELTISELSNLCDDEECLWINGYHSGNGINDRIPLEVANENLTSSLLFIKPEKLKISLREEFRGKRRLRARFEFSGTKYSLIITDPKIEAKYIDKDFGDFVFTNQEIFLCISIGEPFEKFCYKLVAGIIGI